MFSVDVDNAIVFTCVAWSVFQVLLLALFFFINTTIQFLSVIFPLTFKLRRSPLMGAFFVIVVLSTVHTALTLDVIVKDLCQLVFVISAGRKHEELEQNLAKMQIVLAIPLGVFVLTWILTIFMYAAVLKQIHSASASLFKLQVSSEKPLDQLRNRLLFQSRKWHTLIKKNLHKSLILGAGTFAYYLLETPSFLVIYKIVKPNYWALLAHISVHAVTPILHISLSKSFRRAFVGVIRNQRLSFIFPMTPRGSISVIDEDTH
ncbi:unnamed protein product [Mesocestoides corti]|uniref:G protein-coupled receptor n=1 Tax=Mesocestoides corti TaxID=53468 RepID=A0A0R3U4T1_MESCO|nr:unnamed protein product [Mesocestoides corti]